MAVQVWRSGMIMHGSCNEYIVKARKFTFFIHLYSTGSIITISVKQRCWPLMLSNNSWALDLWSLNIMPNEMLLDFSSFSCSLHHNISNRLCNNCNYWQWNCDKENFWIWYPSIWITEAGRSIMWPLSMDTQEHIHWKFVDNQLLLIRHLFEFEYRHHHWWWAIVFDILCRHNHQFQFRWIGFHTTVVKPF